MSLYYPANIGIVTSGLGLETCSAAQLQAQGRCPSDSLMGYGSALVALFFGSELIEERGKITTWMAPVQNGAITMLFYAEAPTPVSAELIFTGQLLEAPAPFGGQIGIDVPLLPTLPGAPDASLLKMTATLGPMNVTYYAWFRGKKIPYHPNGLRLPEACPHGGFHSPPDSRFRMAPRLTLGRWFRALAVGGHVAEPRLDGPPGIRRRKGGSSRLPDGPCCVALKRGNARANILCRST